MDNQNDALKDVTVHLIAAISLLRKQHSLLTPSKRHALFGTMIADYERAAERGRKAIVWEG